MNMQLFQPAESAPAPKRGGKSSSGGKRSGGGGRGRGRAPRSFNETGEGGVPGHICCECGQTQVCN